MAAKGVYNPRATVKPYPGFNAYHDAENLRSAMKGLGTDEDEIIDILTTRTNLQRQKIIEAFKASYDQSLIDELKSELGGYFECVAEGLMLTPGKFDAKEMANAMEGAGTDEHVLIEILATRTTQQLWALAEAYQSENASSLKDDLKSENSGDFEELLVSLLKGKRDESCHVDEDLANQDAKGLFAAGEDKWGTDETTFIKVFCRRNFAHLRKVFDEYYQLTNKDIEDTVKDEMSGTFQMGMLALVQYAKSPAAYFATKLYESMKGAGTDDRSLIRIIISRCEVDMIDIKAEFMKQYGKSLYSYIQDDVGGDYRKILLRLCGMDDAE
ncbi:annexin A4-like [Chiloscyllium plagiosum]|uniref:annexin A4-like n=1 Tax=Chiloscyllium plagiosum TaxID=36176 RepID=UPI001CB7EEF7|nr:annexin A4-like [Chiloscyllium plagiosum]